MLEKDPCKFVSSPLVKFELNYLIRDNKLKCSRDKVTQAKIDLLIMLGQWS